MKDDRQFIADLGRSRGAVNGFALMCREKGVNAWLPPDRVRPSADCRMDYSDVGDLMIQGRVEHKVRTNLTWTCREDYPFNTVIIDEKYKEDKKASDPPLMYVIEDMTRKYAAVIYGWTRSEWIVETIFDKNQNRECHNYTVPKDRVRFCKVSEVF